MNCEHFFGEGTIEEGREGDLVRFECIACGDVDYIQMDVLVEAETWPDVPDDARFTEDLVVSLDRRGEKVHDRWELPSLGRQ